MAGIPEELITGQMPSSISSSSSNSLLEVNSGCDPNHQSRHKQPPPPTKAFENPPNPSSLEKYNTFHRFPDLPKELRDLIWQHSIEVSLQPRVHVLAYKVIKPHTRWSKCFLYSNTPRICNGYWTFKTGPNPVPSVCQEARFWSRKHFSTLKSHEVISVGTMHNKKYTKQSRWFNFETDTLLLDYHVKEPDYGHQFHASCSDPCWPLRYPPSFTRSVKQLAITSHLWYGNLSSEESKMFFRESQLNKHEPPETNFHSDFVLAFPKLDRVSLIYSRPTMRPESVDSGSGSKDADNNRECYIYNIINVKQVKSHSRSVDLLFRHFKSYLKEGNTDYLSMGRRSRENLRVHLVTVEGLNKE